MAKKNTSEIKIFNQPYNICPRYPEGTTWFVYVGSRYSSGGWGRHSFASCLEYLRDQYALAVKNTKARRRAGDEYCEREFWGYIEGPGGMMDWNTIEALVKSNA